MMQYSSFFGFRSTPFRNAPDTNFFVALENTVQTESAILSSLSGGHGLAILIGDVGTGKTTLTHHMIHTLPEETHVFWLAYPPETPDELYYFILRDLGVRSPPTGRTLLLDEIRSVLMRESLQRPYLLVVDEAHYISDDVLDSLKFLNNLEGNEAKLLQILLVAQEELVPILQKPRHKALVQRISCLRRMRRLTPLQSLHYIKNRLEKADGSLQIFTQDALKVLLKKAEGLPRQINNLSHEALLSAFFRKSRLVEVSDVIRALLSHRIEADPDQAIPQKHVPTQKKSLLTNSFRIPPFVHRWALPATLALIVLLLGFVVANGRFFTGEAFISQDVIRAEAANSNARMPSTIQETSGQVARVSSTGGSQSPAVSAPPRIGAEVGIPVEVVRSAEMDIAAQTPVFDQGDESRSAFQSHPLWGSVGSFEEHFFRPYTVQVGTFATEEQALDAFRAWQSKGYPVYQHVVQRDAETRWYVVRLGGYDSMDQASEATALFNKLEKEKAIPVAVADRTPGNRTVVVALPGPRHDATKSVGRKRLPPPPQVDHTARPPTFVTGGSPEMYRLLAEGQVRTYVMHNPSVKESATGAGIFEAGFVEVGVHTNRSAAVAEVDLFVEAGWSASVFAMDVADTIHHRVLVGPFDSPDEARRIKNFATESVIALEYLRQAFSDAVTQRVGGANDQWRVALGDVENVEILVDLVAYYGWPVQGTSENSVYIGPFSSDQEAQDQLQLAAEGMAWGPLLGAGS